MVFQDIQTGYFKPVCHKIKSVFKKKVVSLTFKLQNTKLMNIISTYHAYTWAFVASERLSREPIV